MLSSRGRLQCMVIKLKRGFSARKLPGICFLSHEKTTSHGPNMAGTRRALLGHLVSTDKWSDGARRGELRKDSGAKVSAWPDPFLADRAGRTDEDGASMGVHAGFGENLVMGGCAKGNTGNHFIASNLADENPIPVHGPSSPSLRHATDMSHQPRTVRIFLTHRVRSYATSHAFIQKYQRTRRHSDWLFPSPSDSFVSLTGNAIVHTQTQNQNKQSKREYARLGRLLKYSQLKKVYVDAMQGMPYAIPREREKQHQKRNQR
ncbi:uncharacterized protein BDR25DRAFT_395051 [Lindgomyces ingoldianus]|uniref:Uncharacterized protein n=1 Tax=Lindgomyces ingoldianus TaxID=673940 RepID=A0ACB6QMU9_9PLEO|nr:uncharacterized protein BDR25DRAFT_395051 [Lindgomyces ingoldianus]KAF2467845.1 hypothetical protein BDR25DRAFT_395051 [Lindgomyces ingoldianus]